MIKGYCKANKRVHTKESIGICFFYCQKFAKFKVKWYNIIALNILPKLQIERDLVLSITINCLLLMSFAETSIF